MLPLQDYYADINLLEPCNITAAFNDTGDLVQELIALLADESDEAQQFFASFPVRTRRKLLHAYLDIREPDPLKAEVLTGIEGLLKKENLAKNITDASDITQCGDGFSLWRGDITCLKADVITNAANTYMLGCRKPLHACIDNAIHAAAGPRLRFDCHTIMQKQGNLEPTGRAKITRGYALPARFVLHTVGPIVQPGQKPSRIEAGLLASSYTSCLKAVAELNTLLVQAGELPSRSIAFCGISTGVFGYPQRDAAKVAIETVQEWQRSATEKLHVIFNVFSQEAEEIYRELLNIDK